MLIATLSREDAAAAVAYAECQARHRGAVAAYVAARDAIIKANEDLARKAK